MVNSVEFSWLFPQNDRERKESLRQPTKYLEFEEEFQQLILRKEKQGLVYWLKPDEDYRKVSAFLEQITDPITGSNYKPLILKDTFWKSEWDSKAGKYSKNSDRVICNYRMGEHDYYPVMELLYQSNPTMVPVLRFQKKEQ